MLQPYPALETITIPLALVPDHTVSAADPESERDHISPLLWGSTPYPLVADSR